MLPEGGQKHHQLVLNRACCPQARADRPTRLADIALCFNHLKRMQVDSCLFSCRCRVNCSLALPCSAYDLARTAAMSPVAIMVASWVTMLQTMLVMTPIIRVVGGLFTAAGGRMNGARRRMIQI